MLHANEQTRQTAIIEQLAKRDTNPNSDEMDLDAFDPWEGLGLPLGPYNGAVEHDVLVVLEGILAGKFMTDIASETGLTEGHVELIQYMLCDADVCDYGTSPRGCWVIHGMKEEVSKLAQRWRKTFDSWNE